MKSILTFILATFLLFPLQAQEKVYTVDNLPKVHLQNKMQYVCNPAGILSQAACDSIDSMLYALEQQTGIETVVAVVPSIGEEDCFDFCHQLLNKWGVGKKGKNNGLVILLVTDQRCIQFYTGYGLEGVLPDAICKRIQTRYMIPYLKDGNWDAGMVAGLKATCQRLDGSMENDALSDSNDGGSFDFILAILCFIAIGGGLAFFSARKQSRCPNCGKHQLQRSGSRVVSRINGVKTEDVTYTCRNCGHTIIRRQQSYDNDYHHRGRWRRRSIYRRLWRRQFRKRRRLRWGQLRRRNGRRRWCRFSFLKKTSKKNKLSNSIKTRNMKKSIIIILAVVAILVIWAVSVYNGLVTMDENVSGQWANVETQYQRRADLIPNLVNTVKGYATHEKETLEGVVAARSQATQIKVDAADLTPEKLAQYQKAQGAVTSALGKLLAITENYPDLKANQNFLELQAQLEGTENRINVARKNFNDAAQAYNTNIRRFPKNIFAGMFGFDKKAYFEAEEGSEKAPKVEF